MPCNSITTQTLSGGLSNAIGEIVAAAFVGAGWQIVSQSDGAVIARRNGRERAEWNSGLGLKVTTLGAVEAAKAEIMQSYSKSAVSWAAKRAGWKVGAWQGNKVTVQR